VITQIGGSLMLPEVMQAMEGASHHFVQLDELMDAVGARIAELTRAESAIVTSGCAAAMTHATAAAIAGADPEKLRRLPNLSGLKNEVVIPSYSRTLYDQAIRMLGVKMVEVDTLEKLRAALNPATAMVYVLGCPNDKGPFGLQPIAEAAKARGIPVLVDAAAEGLMVPNIHLERGATMVAYSGGKVLRGPQCAGLLLGRKDLVRAAWIHGAPHHSFGRPMKVGKEEIIGMLAAVEAWFKRDHAAEWKQWEAWLEHIATAVKRIPGVTTETVPPVSLTGYCPMLRIAWDGSKLGIAGVDVQDILWEQNPRIALANATGDRRRPEASSVSIRPLMMSPGEEHIVADRLYALLSKPPKRPAETLGAPADAGGQWAVEIEYVCGRVEHTFFITQARDKLAGMHRGEVLSGDLGGYVSGQQVRIRTAQRCEGNWLRYEFGGEITGDRMTGTLELGEYGQARWTAQRQPYRDPSQFPPPAKNS
jgi:L-seryl-tRNA(Ser) seleniumtransferase